MPRESRSFEKVIYVTVTRHKEETQTMKNRQICVTCKEVALA